MAMKKKAFVYRYGEDWIMEFVSELRIAMYFKTLSAAKVYAKETRLSLKRAYGCDGCDDV
jgi:hypothetical protein